MEKVQKPPEISRNNPTCFLFLVDQSGSMVNPWGVDAKKSKAEGVADEVNHLLEALVSRCSKGTQVVDRYKIGVITYGGDPKDPNHVAYLPGESGEALHAVSEIAQMVRTVQRESAGDAGGQTIEVPVWLDAVAAGQTPMCQALQLAQEVVSGFIAEHPKCYPPVVFNITDGKPSDANPLPVAEAVQKLSSEGGNVVLFNIHISDRCATPIKFADSEANLPDQYARLLFRMSSPLPASMLRIAQSEELPISEGAKAFAFNADVDSVVTLLVSVGKRLSLQPEGDRPGSRRTGIRGRSLRKRHLTRLGMS